MAGLFYKGQPPGPGRPKGSGMVKAEAAKFLHELVYDPIYRENLRKALRARKVAPAFEIFLWSHAAGVPKQRHEHTGADDGPIQIAAVPLSQLTDQQLDVLEQVLVTADPVPVIGPSDPQ